MAPRFSRQAVFREVPPRNLKLFLDKQTSFLKGSLQALSELKYERSLVSGDHSPTAENLKEVFNQNLNLHKIMVSWPKENFEQLSTVFRHDLERLHKEGLDLNLQPYFYKLLSTYGTRQHQTFLALWPRIILHARNRLAGFKPDISVSDSFGRIKEQIRNLISSLDSAYDIKSVHFAYSEFEKKIKSSGIISILSSPGNSKLKKSLSNLFSTIKAAHNRIKLLALPDREPKRTSKIETLYHASINAVQLKQKGFFKNWVPGGGLGGSRSTKDFSKGVSFTYDLYIAKEIARALKIASLIARKQVTAHHILDWAKRSNILKKTIEGSGLENLHSLEKPENVMSLYRGFLSATERKGKGYDPFFMGSAKSLMSILSSTSPHNIGVVACSINMEDPNIKYLPREREYRIPVEAIISIDKLIA